MLCVFDPLSPKSRWLQDLDEAAADHDWEFSVKGACQLGKAPVVGDSYVE